MESSRRGKRRKHSKTINDEESLQVNGKQGEEQNVDPMKKLRLLESLHTNDTKVTCCDFGPEREILLPNYFFCHPCKDWENRNRENKRLNREMKKI